VKDHCWERATSVAHLSSAGLRAAMDHKGWHSRGYLPHFDSQDVVQFVTFRLVDSLPQEVVAKLHYWRKARREKRTVKSPNRSILAGRLLGSIYPE
jgi:hypothetical protein